MYAKKLQTYQGIRKRDLRIKEKGLTNREIADKFGFKLEQVKGLIKRHNAKQRKLEADIALKRKGRPPKDLYCQRTK